MLRRTFIQGGSALALSALLALDKPGVFASPKMAFSTLGCPDWSFDQILAFAKQYRFPGLEIRGLQRQLDLTQCPEFSDASAIQGSIRKLKDAGVKIVNLGASTTLHLPPGPEKDKAMDEARRFIDLAAALSCPYIRVFPNNLPKGEEKTAVLDRIRNGLSTLADYAKQRSVIVLMETHGDLVYADDLVAVMQPLGHTHAGLVWDCVNMFSVTKEAPAIVYPKLKPYILHTHIKDYRMENGKMRYCLLGKGESPIMAAVELLRRDNYKGYYSFEWEKLWHPEIEAPEIAIADYAQTMYAYFRK
jgi:sugar phosphate isomerase/epimerase